MMINGETIVDVVFAQSLAVESSLVIAVGVVDGRKNIIGGLFRGGGKGM